MPNDLIIVTHCRNADEQDFVALLQCLDADVRPTHFSDTEGHLQSGDLINDRERFRHFRECNPCGYFLTAHRCVYSVSPGLEKSNYTCITVFGNTWQGQNGRLDDDLCFTLLDALRQGCLVFGFAAEEKEYHHRNRLSLTRLVGDIHSWVGRNLDNYLPGLYWLTAISEDYLAEKHIALETMPQWVQRYPPVGPLHCGMYRLFKQSWQWRDHAKRIDSLCENTPGVFAIRRVKKQVWKYWRFTSLMAFLGKYR